jgi:hypothetical protein
MKYLRVLGGSEQTFVVDPWKCQTPAASRHTGGTLICVRKMWGGSAPHGHRPFKRMRARASAISSQKAPCVAAGRRKRNGGVPGALLPRFFLNSLGKQPGRLHIGPPIYLPQVELTLPNSLEVLDARPLAIRAKGTARSGGDQRHRYCHAPGRDSGDLRITLVSETRGVQEQLGVTGTPRTAFLDPRIVIATARLPRQRVT